MRERLGRQPTGFWNCGIAPCGWEGERPSGAMLHGNSLQVEALLGHPLTVWIGGCRSTGFGARAGFGVFWGDGSPFNGGYALEGVVRTAQRAEVRALAKVLQGAVVPVVVISDSHNTVRTMQQLQAGRKADWRHTDLWELIAARRHLVQEIRWIRSHLTAEEALNKGSRYKIGKATETQMP